MRSAGVATHQRGPTAVLAAPEARVFSRRRWRTVAPPRYAAPTNIMAPMEPMSDWKPTYSAAAPPTDDPRIDPTPPAVPPMAVPGADPSAPKPPGQDAGPADASPSGTSQPDAAPTKTPERPAEKTATTSPTKEGTGGSTKRPTKSDEPRRPLGKGYIYVLTSPTSRVYFDGRLLGTTPIMKRSVPAGRHSLRLVTAGFPPKQLRTHIERGKVTQVRHLFRQQ